MQDIAVLGSGKVGASLAAKLASAGRHVVIGTRDPASASAKWSGPKVSFANPAAAADDAALVINATPGDSSVERLGAMKTTLRGKVLVDVSNATRRGANGAPGGLIYPNDSVAEHLQNALPEVRVVKTLNTMLFTVMTDPQSLSPHPTAFLSGDDEGAKADVRALLKDLGWADEWIEDLGGISTARGTEAFMLLVPAIVATRGFKPFALTVAR